MPTKTMTMYNVDDPSDHLTCSYQTIDVCPICNHAVVPEVLHGYYIEDGPSLFSPNKTFRVHIAFFCPNCRKTFSADYNAHQPSGRTSYSICTSDLTGLYPKFVPGTHFSTEIQELSPVFVTTYNQSETAEASGLDQITGIGYRKALEFLVKDYLCRKLPDEAEAIKGERLSASIARIEDERVKTLASRSAWIGNDETHYVRKHETRDVEDMKRFIKALIHFIEAELAFEDALSIPYKK